MASFFYVIQKCVSMNGGTLSVFIRFFIILGGLLLVLNVVPVLADLIAKVLRF